MRSKIFYKVNTIIEFLINDENISQNSLKRLIRFKTLIPISVVSLLLF
jgi:hypothetical protein